MLGFSVRKAPEVFLAKMNLDAPRWNLGVLNPQAGNDVPGTIVVISEGTQDQDSIDDRIYRGQSFPRRRLTQSLKRTPDGEFTLEPQPDDSPNDPLNWSINRRNAALWSLGFYCMMGGGMITILAAGFDQIAASFHVSTQEVALTTGQYMVGLGVGSVVMSPTAILFGKRPVYLFSVIGFILTNVWSAKSSSYISLALARVLQGISVSPIECLPSTSITELFFLHERAYRLGIYTSLLLGAKHLVALVSGVVVHHLGWRWIFWIAAIVVGFLGTLVFLFVPETLWARSPVPGEAVFPYNSSSADKGPSHVARSSNIKTQEQNNQDIEDYPEVSVIKDPALRYTENLRDSPKHSLFYGLRPYNGRLSNANWFRVAVRPLILLAYPGVLWSAIVYGISVGRLNMLSECMSTLFKREDTYNFNSLETGLLYISPFAGAILGTIITGKVSDAVVRYMSRRNKGIYEPEFRLVMAVPAAIAATAGLIGLGWSVQDLNAWIVPTFFFGLTSFGCTLGATTAVTYCVDSYKEFSSEALVTLNVFKNILHGFIFSLFIVEWLESDGAKNTFAVIGSVHMIIMLSTIPLYIYGKRLRMWTVKRNFMQGFLETF